MFETQHSLVTVNLRRLVMLRSVLIIGQCLLIFLAVSWLQMQLPLGELLTVVFLYTFVNGLTWLQLRTQKLISINSFFAHVIGDVIALGALLYYSGGATNPFASLLLLPLIIITTTMPRIYTWIMAALIMLVYSLLMFTHKPMPHSSMQHGTDFDLHIMGMWISFLVAAALIVTFLLRMAESIRQRDHQLSEARERIMQNETLAALGTMAAGAAHEMATPLATMAIVTGELAHLRERVPEIGDRAEMLRLQLQRCKETLNQMSARADQEQTIANLPVRQFLEHTLMQWHNMRPGTRIDKDFSGSPEDLEIRTDPTLAQAMINLVNNGADACPEGLEFSAHWDREYLRVQVCDQGPGLPQQKEDLGELFFTTKGDGHGLGLFLARAVIERLGGELSLHDREQGGVCAEFTIPLASMVEGGI